MTWEEVLAYCLAKPGAWQDEPWEGDVVTKVGGKIFAFLGSGENPAIGAQVRADARGRERVAEPLSRRCGCDALHRQVRVELAAHQRRHSAR